MLHLGTYSHALSQLHNSSRDDTRDGGRQSVPTDDVMDTRG
jgi:hypothetical protein